MEYYEDYCTNQSISLCDVVNTISKLVNYDKDKTMNAIKELNLDSFYFPDDFADKMPHSKNAYHSQRRIVFNEMCGMNVLDLADLVQHAKRSTLATLMEKAENEDEILLIGGLTHFQLLYGYHDGGMKNWIQNFISSNR